MKFLFALILAFSFSMSACSDEACAGGNCACEAGGSCEFECPEGNCAQKCQQDATCTFTCEGGNCPQECPANAEKCDFSCSGGNCQQTCPADNCSSTCSGNGCQTLDGNVNIGL